MIFSHFVDGQFVQFGKFGVISSGSDLCPLCACGSFIFLPQKGANVLQKDN